MARKKNGSRFRGLLALVVMVVLLVLVFVMGGRNPEAAKDVEEFSKEQATDLLDKGKEVLEESTNQRE